MLRSWHCIGSTLEYASEGTYRTTVILGRPLITWRRENGFHTFLNICPHRFSTLTDACEGRSDRLVCQYHGWEFDETGNTRKIPDAINFKPLEKGVLGLTQFRVAVVGHLLFVNLSQTPQSIEEFLGPHLSDVQNLFSDKRQLVLQTEQHHQANWKIVIENALESYHVGMVHAKTLGTMAKSEVCTHELLDRSTKFLEDTSLQTSLFWRFSRRLLNFIGYPDNTNYQHLLIYPNVMITTVPPFSLVQWTIPESPTSSRSKWLIFGYFGTLNSLPRLIATPFIKRYARKFFPALLEEDRVIQNAVQRGLNSPENPKGGLISAREERIHHFQRMIADATTPNRDPNVCQVSNLLDNCL